MSWLHLDPPDEIRRYWDKMYAITTIEHNLQMIQEAGYTLIDYFPLPEDAWWEPYYTPLEERLKAIRVTYKDNQKALDYIESEQEEIDLYRKYHHWYG